jgi:hypothetical protein
MTVPLFNFPVAAITDVLLSYLQYVFSNDEITPANYRWVEDDETTENRDGRSSKIRISAPFVIDNDKPQSAPFIVVERGAFGFANQLIDNSRGADPNTFENKKYVDWMDGTVNIICGSGVATEASSLANWLAIMLQADRHGIIKKSHFIRNLNYIGIGPEIPVIKDTEVRRWEVILSLRVSLQIGWLQVTREPILWKSAEFYATNSPPEVFSNKGATSLGSDLLVDTTQDFGHLEANNPYLIQREFDRGWYSVQFKANANKQLYTIVEIVDNNTLRLETHDVNGDPVAYSAPAGATDLEYDLLWNSLHIKMELPNNS